jgi:hypothetical protein
MVQDILSTSLVMECIHDKNVVVLLLNKEGQNSIFQARNQYIGIHSRSKEIVGI